MSDWQQLTTELYCLAESPFWHPSEHRLYWVDIVARKICRSTVNSSQVDTWLLPSDAGCIAPMLGGGLVIAMRSGVYVAKNWQGEVKHLVTLPYDATSVRTNDGKCDALGRFWIGTIDESKTSQAAALYCVDCTSAEWKVTCHQRNATTANGLAWSPDQRTIYWADTPEHQVWQWDFDVNASTMKHKKKIFGMEPKTT